MSPLLIFRHIRHEGPGYLAGFLRHRQIPYQMICIDAGESVPGSLDDVSGLVFMGGPMSVNDSLPWINDEISLIRMAIARDMPILGHCLGGQLIAKALDAEVGPNPVAEIGWHKTRVINGPASGDWLPGIDREIELFHWHGETFAIPDGASRILESEFCHNQAFVFGNIMAMQCHIEMTESLVKKWVAEADGKLDISASVQSATQMLEDLGSRVSHLHRIADTIYDRWIQGL